jgi:hypothetical protein
MNFSGTDKQTAESVLSAAITEPETFDSDQLNQVLQLFESHDRTVRLTASWTLGLVVSSNPDAVSGSVRALASLLVTEPESTHEEIIRTLGYIGSHHPELVRDAVEDLDLRTDEFGHGSRIISAIDSYEPSGDGTVFTTSGGEHDDYEGLAATAPTDSSRKNTGPTRSDRRGRPPSDAPPTPPEVDCRRGGFEPIEPLESGSHVELWQVQYETGSGTHTALLKQFQHRVPAEFDTEFTKTLSQWQAIDRHGSVVPVIAHGTIPKPWFVVEYQEGTRLSNRVDSRSLREACWIIDRVVDAVCHAHSAGVIHGGLTPRNVIFTPTYDDPVWAYPKVSNWGISQLLCQLSVLPIGVPPAYAAPEQVAPEQFGGIDAATDIYHLGLVVYEILAGRPPFDGHSEVALRKAVDDPPPPASRYNDHVTERVDTVLSKCLRKSKLYRYSTVQDFQAELRLALRGGSK